jgi:hypothetical protein
MRLSAAVVSTSVMVSAATTIHTGVGSDQASLRTCSRKVRTLAKNNGASLHTPTNLKRSPKSILLVNLAGLLTDAARCPGVDATERGGAGLPAEIGAWPMTERSEPLPIHRRVRVRSPSYPVRES